MVVLVIKGIRVMVMGLLGPTRTSVKDSIKVYVLQGEAVSTSTGAWNVGSLVMVNTYVTGSWEINQQTSHKCRPVGRTMPSSD